MAWNYWLSVALVLVLQAGLVAADYNGWRGSGSGSAGRCNIPLVAGWDQARIAWVSEAKSPHPWNFSIVRGKTQWPRTVLGNGGYCQPAVVAGRVYVMYWRGTGRKLATTGPGKYDRRWAHSNVQSLQQIDADAVIVCMDAKTGQTLWETVFKNTEMNHVELYGGHNNLRVAGGRVFALGGTGLLYAVDARSGKKLWVQELGPSAALWRWYKADCMRRSSKESKPPASIPEDATVPPAPAPPDGPKHPLGGSLNNATYNICPLVVGDVVITGDWARSPTLSAFKVDTGALLWKAPRVGGTTGPLPWGDDKVLIPSMQGIHAREARSGKVLWSLDAAAGPTNCAVSGDILVAPGRVPKARKSELGWSAWKLTAAGATKLWQLDTRYKAIGYQAAVIHEGYAWLPFTRGKNLPETDQPIAPVKRGTMGLVCVDLATGKVGAEVLDIPANNVCPGPIAMGDRLLYQYDKGLVMVALDPQSPRLLGLSKQHSNYCSSCAVADGFVYFRSGADLVVCLDVRHPDHLKRERVQSTNMDHAHLQVDIPSLHRQGHAVRLHMQTRQGVCVQSWLETQGPGIGYPDVVEWQTCRLTDKRLQAAGRAILDGSPHDLELDIQLSDAGGISGQCRDTYSGLPLAAELAGTMQHRVQQDGDLLLQLPRHFFNGQNQMQEPILEVAVRAGRVSSVGMRTRRGTDSFTATVSKQSLRWQDGKLQGPVHFDIVSRSEIIGGRYVLKFDAVLRQNLVYGTFTAQREGAAETKHTITTYPPFSTALPIKDPLSNWDAGVVLLSLPKAVTSTMGVFDLALRLDLGSDARQGIATTSTVGIFPVQLDQYRRDGNRCRVRCTVTIHPDGYALRNSTSNVYDLDLTLNGKEVTGRYQGQADARSARQLALGGRWWDLP